MDAKWCAYCGGPATHYCPGCGNWICDRVLCMAKGAAKALGIPVATRGPNNA